MTAAYVPSAISDIADLNPLLRRRLRVVAGRGAVPTVLTDGLNQAATYRNKYYAPQACTNLQLLMGNWSMTLAADVPTTASISVKTAVEYPYGAAPGTPGLILPAFFNGVRTGTIEGGGMRLTDPVGIDVAAGTFLGVRTYVSSNAGASPNWVYPLGSSAATDNQGFVKDSDLVDSGSITNGFSYCYGPLAIVGTPLDPDAPSLLIVGDSIAFGVSDPGYSNLGEGGWVNRALGPLYTPSIPTIRCAISSALLAPYVATGSSYVRPYKTSLFGLCKHALIQIGINDFTAGTTAATHQSNFSKLVTALKLQGCKVWASTLLPKSNSTDSWATLGNQTADTYNAARVTFNNAIRSTYASLGLEGFFEAADAVESARDSGKWAVSGGTNALGVTMTGVLTGDGTHPNSLGYSVVAANCNFARFT